MNITETGERIALGNLSNSKNAFVYSTQTNIKSLTDISYKKKSQRTNVDTPFPNKTSNKAVLNNIAKNDPENYQQHPIFSSSTYEESNSGSAEILSPFLTSKKLENMKPKTIIKHKSPLSVVQSNFSHNTLNKKRPFKSIYNAEEDPKEEKFSQSYFIEDEMSIEYDYKKKLRKVADNLSLRETFQTFDCDLGIQLEKRFEEDVNIYEDFAIDLTFYKGKLFIWMLLNSKDLVIEESQERDIENHIQHFIQQDLNEFKGYYLETIIE